VSFSQAGHSNAAEPFILSSLYNYDWHKTSPADQLEVTIWLVLCNNDMEESQQRNFSERGGLIATPLHSDCAI